mmetsp:Transcript_56551/g.93456  ORF Transcript_56551/g.93456 Transcript_56551/m.93456 type:complete len:353 (-) Transcript_56551:232-1290(-)
MSDRLLDKLDVVKASQRFAVVQELSRLGRTALLNASGDDECTKPPQAFIGPRPVRTRYRPRGSRSVLFDQAVDSEVVSYRRCHARLLVAKPRVLIHCPQNSACTMFALYLCELLNAVCRPDTDCADVDVWHVPESLSYVHKATFNGGGVDNIETSRVTRFTHRILWFRDPVQNYLSLVRKRYCRNCGGFAQKWASVELSYRAHYERTLTPFYDAVIFEEDYYKPARLVALLWRLGLRGDFLEAYKMRGAGNLSTLRITNHMRGFQMGGVDDIRAHGSFRFEKHSTAVSPSPTIRPFFCIAAEAMQNYTPTLFRRYYPQGTHHCVRKSLFDHVDCPLRQGREQDVPQRCIYCT